MDMDKIRRDLELVKNTHRHDQRGYFSLAELPQKPDIGASAISPGYDVLSAIWKIYPGQFTIVTGTPGHGKSTLVLNVVCNIARTHDCRSYLYVPENESFLKYKLRRIYGNDGFDQFANEQCFIQSAEVETYNQAPKTLDWVLERAVVAIKNDGVRLLVIDPWNELEHAKPRDVSMTDYIRDCLMFLKQFSFESILC